MSPSSSLDNTHSEFPQLQEAESKMIISMYHERHFGIIGKRRQAYLDIFEGGKHIMDQVIFTFMHVSSRQLYILQCSLYFHSQVHGEAAP
jgi:hypothetical protein